MAASGMRFNHYYAAAPLCSPTRGSILTGRNPNRFACFKWGHTLRPQEVTLAEILQKEGYSTGHFGKWHLGSVRAGSPVNPGASGFDHWFSALNFFDLDPILSRKGVAEKVAGESSMVVVNEAIDFIRTQTTDSKPFFTVIWFGSPHNPHQAMESDKQLYPDQPEALQDFYGEITALDRAVGKLRQELQTLKIKENTLVWYCSDNGGLPRVGSTGGRGHKSQLYEGGLRVPAIIEWPAGIKSGQIEVPASTVDIFPTIMEVTGIDYQSKLPIDGISLLPIIKGDQLQREKPMGFWSYPVAGDPAGVALMEDHLLEQQQVTTSIDSALLDLDAWIIHSYTSDSFPGHAAWLDWPYKLHQLPGEKSVAYELYNLTLDSMEQVNLAEKEVSTVQKMQEQLITWQKSVLHSLNGGDYDAAEVF
jgi:arylsulfatase A-like enzyme